MEADLYCIPELCEFGEYWLNNYGVGGSGGGEGEGVEGMNAKVSR